MRANAVLVMDWDDTVHKLHIKYIHEDQVPERFNGESGLHIYHVRMLTEELLREFSEKDNGISFSEEEIQMMSIAASLHDVGKMRIPKNILNSPRSLSSEEYAIVKRHTSLGEEMISQAFADGIDPKIIQYAKVIARGHHERFDGSGYPDGLAGNALPIWLQVVAAADAYDALIRNRCYKQGYPQKMAAQMLIHGKCGIFQKEILDCLKHVIERK